MLQKVKEVVAVYEDLVKALGGSDGGFYGPSKALYLTATLFEGALANTPAMTPQEEAERPLQKKIDELETKIKEERADQNAKINNLDGQVRSANTQIGELNTKLKEARKRKRSAAPK